MMRTQNFEHLAGLYHCIFLYCGVGAILFAAAAVVLFIWLKIPKVFLELSGHTARAAIARMSAQQEKGGRVRRRMSVVKMARKAAAAPETAAISDAVRGTSSDSPDCCTVSLPENGGFCVIRSIVKVHTGEVIE